MELDRNEEDALAGKHGDALASAYRILVAIGEATDAKMLIPVQWAHVSGVNYNTIGDAGTEFLENFSADAKVAIRTTVNPMGYDRTKPDGIPYGFREKQARIASSYERMGVTPSFTCTPYEVFDVPQPGSAVSFAESNAVVFSNSLLGLLTNKESALSALASAVSGKAPLSDLRLEQARHPKVTIRANFEFQSELDYGLLGYFAGKVVNQSCVAIDGVSKPSVGESKALSAAIGTSGSCGMFTFDKTGNERISFGKKEAQDVMDELCTSENGGIIALGSPQLGMHELESLSRLVAGKKFTRRCIIFCSKAIHCQATKAGVAETIESSGAEFLCDSCTCLTPYVTKDLYDSAITNSVKAAYYLNNSNKVKVALKDMRTIVKEYMK